MSSTRRGSTFSYEADDAGASLAMQPANPFFDNIRQNMELSHDGISERLPLNLPGEIIARANELPEWLKALVILPPAEAAERLANEFYQVELKEQKRLQAIMNWHSRTPHARSLARNSLSPGTAPPTAGEVFGSNYTTVQASADAEDSYFPFSIAAGVERGAKNRQVVALILLYPPCR